MRRKTTRRAAQAGFSLIELMVVITIIGILGAFVGANVWSAMTKTNVTSTKNQMLAIENAIKTYRLDKRRVPDSLDELVPDYLDSGSVPKDAWGNEFIYSKEGRTKFTLVSYGADGEAGGEGEEADLDRDSIRSTDSEEGE